MPEIGGQVGAERTIMKICKTLKTVLATGTLVLGVATALIPISQPARANGGHFVGGLVAGHVITNMASRSERRTQAAEYQAYSQPATTTQQAPASQTAAQPQSSSPSAKERLSTLDQLAAGGYISKEEYQRRRQAIIDSL